MLNNRSNADRNHVSIQINGFNTRIVRSQYVLDEDSKKKDREGISVISALASAREKAGAKSMLGERINNYIILLKKYNMQRLTFAQKLNGYLEGLGADKLTYIGAGAEKLVFDMNNGYVAQISSDSKPSKVYDSEFVNARIDYCIIKIGERYVRVEVYPLLILSTQADAKTRAEGLVKLRSASRDGILFVDIKEDNFGFAVDNGVLKPKILDCGAMVTINEFIARTLAECKEKIEFHASLNMANDSERLRIALANTISDIKGEYFDINGSSLSKEQVNKIIEDIISSRRSKLSIKTRLFSIDGEDITAAFLKYADNALDRYYDEKKEIDIYSRDCKEAKEYVFKELLRYGEFTQEQLEQTWIKYWDAQKEK